MSEGVTGNGRDPLAGIDAMLPYRYAARPAGGYTVVRKDLLRSLTEATLVKQLSVVRGPAGSGKSTLLAQWREVCRDMNRPVAWLTIDQADRHLPRFVEGLAAAVERAGCAEIAAAFRAMPEAVLHASPVHISQYLASTCNRSDNRIAIALDQFEEADDDVLGEVLSGFLGHSVDTRLVIASRTRLRFPLGNLRARDQVFEIGASDLNLTPLETHDLFGWMPEIFTRRLHYETSGEAVAVGFARRAMEPISRDLAGLDGWQDQLHEYYRTGVLDRLPIDMREAMSRLIIVERFDLSLASALIGRNATSLIERLHHGDGILLRHRGSQEFYFSEMLRRFLETRLGWLTDGEHKALHRCAAAWFADRGRQSEALRHAVEAGDCDHARDLLDRIGLANVVLQQGVAAAHKLFEAIGVALEDAPIEFHSSLAIIHAHEGRLDQAVRHLDEVRRAARGDEAIAAGVAEQLTLAEAIVAGLSDDSNVAGTAPALSHYLRSAPAGDHENRALAQIFLSWVSFCQGDPTTALALSAGAAEDYAETDAVFGSVYMHIHRVIYMLWLNELEGALEEATLAEQITLIFFPNDPRLRATTAALRAGLLFELGRPDPLTDMTALVGTVGAVAQWAEIQIWCHVQGARAALAKGASQEARGIVAYGIEVSERLDSPRLRWALELLGVEISLHQGEFRRAHSEARALGLCDITQLNQLPSYLTWQERICAALLAAQLYETKNDPERADTMIDAVRSMLAQIVVPRLEARLAVVEAGLSYSRGDKEGADRQLAAARELHKDGWPIGYFPDGHEANPAVPPTVHRLTSGHALASASVATDAGLAREDPLTARERQILLLLGEGYQNKVAAHRLGLSEATVKFHLRNIYRKLHAQNRTQALAHYRSFVDVWAV